MTRKEIYTIVKMAADGLKVKHEFRRGRKSELSSLNKDFPVIWMETKTDSPETSTELSSNSLPIDDKTIALWIAKLDREGSIPEEYECLIDDCDAVAQSMIFRLNTVVAGNNLLTLTSIARTPFVKELAASATGVLLTFTLNGPDKTDQSENCP